VASIGAAAVVVLRHDEPEPHAFRVVIDHGWSEATRIVWRDGAKPLSLGVPAALHVVSPNGRTAAFGSQRDDRLRYVDLVSRRLSLGPRMTKYRWSESCAADPHVWTRSNRIIATGWCGDVHRTAASTLAVVDPDKTVRIRTIGDGPIVRAGGGAVLLVSPPPGPPLDDSDVLEERLGPSRLLRVDADGSLSGEVRLRIHSGMRNSRTTIRFLGLAVRGNRAVVVSEDQGTAEVDLRTLAVRYHPVSFPAPLRRLLPAPVQHQGTANPARIISRQPRWLDDNRIVVTGYDVWTKDHNNQCGEAGPWILDTRIWKARRISRSSKLVVKQRPYTTRCSS
jgi:hypothetical protein